MKNYRERENSNMSKEEIERISIARFNSFKDGYKNDL